MFKVKNMFFMFASDEAIEDYSCVRMKVSRYLEEFRFLEAVEICRSKFVVVIGISPAGLPQPWCQLSEDGSGARCIYFGLDTQSRRFKSERAKSAQSAFERRVPLSSHGAYFAIKIAEDGRADAFLTDPIGAAWVYAAKSGTSCVLSSHYSLVTSFADARRVDASQAAIEFLLSYSPNENTILREVSALPPGSLLKLQEGQIEVTESLGQSYGDAHAGVPIDQKFSILDSIFHDIARDNFDDVGLSQVLSLSAGLDSRYGLALALQSNVPVKLCTFGLQESNEVAGAVDVASRIGREPSVLVPSEFSSDVWRRTIQRLGNAGFAQWSGWSEQWLAFVRCHGEASIVGFLGDALTGKHVSPPKGHHVHHSIEAWLRWSWPVWAQAILRNGAKERELRSLCYESLADLAARASYAFPHQVQMHLDVLGRQRRFVAAQSNIIADFVSPTLFFLNTRLMDFFFNVAFADIDRQLLYKEYALSRFPKLFERARPSYVRMYSRKVLNKLRSAASPHGGQRYIRPIPRSDIIRANAKLITRMVDDDPCQLSQMFDLNLIKRWVASTSESQLSPHQELCVIRMTNTQLLGQLSLA